MASSLNRLMSKRNSTGFRRKANKIGETFISNEKQKRSETQVVTDITTKLNKLGLENPDEEQIKEALHSKYASGDEKKAFELFCIQKDAAAGIIEDIKKDVKLLGAENNGKVTCYLDSLLFSLYARLDSFEPMLCNEFDDPNIKELSARLRIFVNMLRSGLLVNTDQMAKIQESLGKCGWKAGSRKEQQDASEAFAFIAEKLEMPLLTLKMDIAHGGKDIPDDDHKFVNERLLNLAIPSHAKDSVTLEECLEEYFNNRVDVKRKLERRQTVDSMTSFDEKASIFDDKPSSSTTHIEYADLGSNPNTPIAGTPSSPSAKSFSLLQTVNHEERVGRTRLRRQVSGLRREIMIPAWQFFSILPFYTDNNSSKTATKANFASTFSSRRPIIGLCLKRYTWNAQGFPVRNGIEVKIPTEIDLPHFVGDEDLENPSHFRLSLQSAVCHRGTSVQSGHYISLVRNEGDKWLLFDDLAKIRVIDIDRTQAFAQETPYLLFYQVEIIDDPPPIYEELESTRTSLDTSRSNTSLPGFSEHIPIVTIPTLSSKSGSEPTTPATEIHGDVLAEFDTKLERNATEPMNGTKAEHLRPTSRLEGRRSSNSGIRTSSRSGSRSADNRLSFNLSRLTQKKTKDDAAYNSDVSDQDNSATEKVGKGKEPERKKARSRSKAKSLQFLPAPPRGDQEMTEKGEKDCVIM